MAPVPTPGSRLLRSGKTGLRRSKRTTTQSKTATRRKTAKNKNQSFQQYDEALDNLKKKKKKARNSNDKSVDAAADTHRRKRGKDVLVGIDRRKATRSEEQSFHQYDEGVDNIKKKKKAGRNSNDESLDAVDDTHRQTIRKATKDALVEIGKVYKRSSCSKSDDVIDTELCIDDESTLDLFVPQNDDDTITNASNDDAFGSVTGDEPNTTSSPIILPTLSPITDTGLGDVNTITKDNSANTICEMQNNHASDAKSTKNGTSVSVSATNHKLTCISDIYKSFQLPKSTRSCIPTLTDLRNETNLNEKNHAKWTGLVNMSTKCLDQLLACICPGPSRSKLNVEIAKKVIKKTKKKPVHTKQIIVILRKCYVRYWTYYLQY